MDMDALILANGADYLLRRLVDRAVCSKRGGVEISCTLTVAGAAGILVPRSQRIAWRVSATSTR